MVGGLAFGSGTARAADCDPGKSAGDMTYEDAQAVYECIGDGLVEGYSKKARQALDPLGQVRGLPGVDEGEQHARESRVPYRTLSL